MRKLKLSKNKSKFKFTKKALEERLLIQLYEINYNLKKNRISDFMELTGKPVKLMIRNFTSGVFKGMGIGIGFSIVTAIIIIILQKIIVLNIPVISEYIADIVEIVKQNR